MTNNKDNKNKKDNKKPLETTGHSWDGIEEYNTPTPRWWLTVWIITIIWAFIYWIFFPSWPTIKGNLKGSKEWTSKSQLVESEQEIALKQESYLEKFRKSSFEQILKDQDLLQFALKGGETLFKGNCAPCHGVGANGSKGFPNLNDDDWLWGGKIEDIYQTLMYGIRSGHQKSRESQMPSFGRDGILNKDQIANVVQHVRSLSGLDKPNADGQKIFAENCAVCHGQNAQGDRKFGAPNLTDQIWLYGGSVDDVTYTVYNSRRGVMPNWNERLSEDSIRQLTIYVHSLGGGE